MFLWIGHIFLFICTHCTILWALQQILPKAGFEIFEKAHSYFSFQTCSHQRTSSLFSLLWKLKIFSAIWRHISFFSWSFNYDFFPQLPYTYTWQILSVLDSLSLLLASFGALPVLLCSSISSLLSWISELLWHPCGFHKPWPLLPTVPTHLKFELCCLGYLISELADIENNQATPGQVIMLLVWFLLLFLAHRMELGWGQGFCQTTMSQGVEGRKITSKNVTQCPTNFESSFFFSGY